MILRSITSPEEWEKFQTAQPVAQFQQSWAWGAYRAAHGVPVRRYALVDDHGVWVAAIQMEYRARRFGLGYWFAPRGPVIAGDQKMILEELTRCLMQEQDLKDKAMFWRIEPFIAHGSSMPHAYIRTARMIPPCTFLLDLAPSEDDLLKSMHEKTRYNIRVAERKGVKVRFSTSESDLSAVLDLMDETARRDKFVQHSREHLRGSFRHLADAQMAQLVLAELDGKLLSAEIEVHYADTATYLHGASSSESRNVMAPFAMHWEAIKEAKRRGYATYDFWGANPESKDAYYYQASWEGFTRFKQGWGAVRTCYAGTWDLPLVSRGLYRTIFWKQAVKRGT